MTPERMTRLVARWVRLYTRNLPTPVAERRIEEIDADLHDHVTHERARGTGDGRIALGVLSRMLRGVAADASWRGQRAEGRPALRSVTRVAVATGVVLLIPLVWMQFSDEMAWTAFDFVFAGVMLFGAGLTFQFLARRAGNLGYRAAVALAVGTALLLVWTIGAVGVIGEDGDSADLMYGGVLAVGAIGALIARFRPDGMARALVAMAGAQMLVALIALIAGKHESPISSVVEILGVNAFFAVLFLGSALLFRHTARLRR